MSDQTYKIIMIVLAVTSTLAAIAAIYLLTITF